MLKNNFIPIPMACFILKTNDNLVLNKLIVRAVHTMYDVAYYFIIMIMNFTESMKLVIINILNSRLMFSYNIRFAMMV